MYDSEREFLTDIYKTMNKDDICYHGYTTALCALNDLVVDSSFKPCEFCIFQDSMDFASICVYSLCTAYEGIVLK